jgi:transposase
MKYSSDLNDKEWKVLEPLLPARNKTRPMNWTYREIMNAIMYQMKTECRWGDLPKHFPPYSTVYWHYKQLRSDGVIDKINKELHKLARAKSKKK